MTKDLPSFLPGRIQMQPVVRFTPCLVQVFSVGGSNGAIRFWLGLRHRRI